MFVAHKKWPFKMFVSLANHLLQSGHWNRFSTTRLVLWSLDKLDLGVALTPSLDI